MLVKERGTATGEEEELPEGELVVRRNDRRIGSRSSSDPVVVITVLVAGSDHDRRRKGEI